MVVDLVDEPLGSAHLECRSHEAPAGDLGVRDSELVSFGVPAAGALGPALGVGEEVAHGDEVRLELVHNSSSNASSSDMPVHLIPRTSSNLVSCPTLQIGRASCRERVCPYV